MSATRIPLSATATVAMLATAPMAWAQAVSFDDIDTNGDNVLTLEELAATFGESAALDMLSLYDRDGDGSVAKTEARAVSSEGATNAAAGMRTAEANRAAADERRAAAQDKAEVARAASGRPDFAGGSSEGGGSGQGSSAGSSGDRGESGQSSSAGSSGGGNGADASDRSGGNGRP
jgi:hypothetical protein